MKHIVVVNSLESFEKRNCKDKAQHGKLALLIRNQFTVQHATRSICTLQALSENGMKNLTQIQDRDNTV